MKYKLLLVLLIISKLSFSQQIVNIERMRLDNDTSTFITYLSGNFNKKLTKYDETSFNGCFNFYYKVDNHVFINIISSNVYILDNIFDEYSYFEHFRYNYNMNNFLTNELFIQYKYDNQLDIDKSYLFGTGIRLKLFKNKTNNIYIGVSLMYQYKQLLDKSDSEALRNSNYITFNYKFTKDLFFISTTYYQPKINDITNFKVSNNNSLFFKVNRFLEFSVFYNTSYNSCPPPGIDNNLYNTGIKLIVKYNN
jgi:uncharacterized protein DUF481